MNTAALTAALNAQKSALKSAGATVIPVTYNLNTAGLTASLLAAQKAAAAGSSSVPVNFNVNTAGLTAKLIAAQKAAAAAGAATVPVTYSVNAAGLVAGLAAAKTAAAAAGATTVPLNLAVNPASAAAATAAAGAGGQGGAAGGGMLGLAAGAAAAGRALTAFNTRFAITGAGWGAAIGGVALWHIALDGALEALIAVGLAASAAAIGVAAMTPAAKDVALHLKSIQTVNSALGSQIPPLTGQFQALAQAMAPQVIEAYGGALNLLNGRSGVFASTAHQVVNIFDTWIAKIDLWSQSQNGMGKLLQSGVGFLTQFGHIFGETGLAVSNLVKADPGTAHFLLDLIGGFGKVLDVVTSLPTPLLLAGLGLHSIYIWGSVLGGLASKLIVYFQGLGKTMLGLATNPLFWVAAAAVGVGYLATQFGKADSSARSFIAGLNQQLSGETASQAILQISTDIGQMNDKISQAGSSQAITQLKAHWADLGKTAQSFDADTQAVGGDFARSWSQMTSGRVISGLAALGRGIQGIFVPGQGSTQVALNNVKAYQVAIVKLSTGQTRLFGELGNLTKQGYSWSQSLALMNLAGVKWNDRADVMKLKVDNLITGYQNMSVQGGILSNSVNAVTFASLQQQSQVGQLQQGWTSFLKTITGGESAFVTFQQQLDGIATAASNASTSLSVSSGKTSLTTKAAGSSAAGAAASITGLNTASLQLRASFTTGVTDAGNLSNSLLDLTSAAGLGSKGTDLLTQASKDAIAQLLPMAKGSQAATTELYALAQQGGYQGANSFKALSQWVDTASGSMRGSKDPAKQLDTIVSTLTTDAGNLTTDVKNLSTALGTTLNSAMATAVFQASGGQKAFSDFATSVLKTGATSDKTKTAAFNLGSELMTVLGNAGQAKSEFEALAIHGLGQTKQKADDLWLSFTKQKLTDAGSKAGETKTQFETLATQLGWTKTAADKLWTSLHKVAAGSPYSASLLENGKGQFSIQQMTSATNPYKGGISGRAARGMYVAAGTPGVDDQLILAQRGELVVPTPIVSSGAVDHLRGRIPGFATGGVVGGIAPMAGQTTAFHTEFVGDVTRAMEAAMTTATKAAQAAAQAAAAASSGAPGSMGGPASAGAAQAQSYARSRLGAYGWGAEQMNYLIPLWNQESGWNRLAKNPSSGAYGIPQALPASKMGAEANPPASSAAAQINWGMPYIKGRYGSPAGAWAHEKAYNWYAKGTDGAAAGWAVTGERGPELVKMHGGETVLPAHLTNKILSGSAAFPGYASGTPNASVLAGLISGAPKEGWQKDASNLRADLKIIATTLGIKGLSRSDVSKLQSEQSKDGDLLVLATAYLKTLTAARKQIMTVTEPKLNTQIAALNSLGKMGKLSASEFRLLKTLRGSLGWQKAELARIDTAIYGPAAKKAAAASATDPSGSSGSSGGSAGGSSGGSSGPAPGHFVGVLPSPPGLGAPDITGGGTGGLGGNGSTITGIGGFSSADGYQITPSAPAGQSAGIDAMTAAIVNGNGGNREIVAALERLTAVARAIPAQTGGHLGQTLNGVSRAAYARSMFSSE